MIPVFQPNRRQRKKAERLAAKHRPVMNWALREWGHMQASHECAHAVIAMVLGFGCSRIILNPPHAKITIDLARPYECLVVTYAGAAAVRILNKQECDGFGKGNQNAGTHGDDATMVERCLAEMKEMGLPTEGAADRAKAAAETLVRKFEKLIRKFAAALEEKKILTGPDMATLLQGEGGKAWLAR